MIGFPEFILNATALDERYEEVWFLYSCIGVGIYTVSQKNNTLDF